MPACRPLPGPQIARKGLQFDRPAQNTGPQYPRSAKRSRDALAKFILGNRFRHKATENRLIGRFFWLLDLVFVGAIVGVFRVLPVTWASAVGARLGRVFGRIMKARTKKVRANLSLALPDRTPQQIDRLASDVWANAGAAMAEYPKLPQIVDPRRDHLKIEILERIATYDDPGQPAVFVGAHLGNWEMMAAAVARLHIPSVGMYAPLANPWFDRLMRRYRAAMGTRLVSRDDGLRPFIEALKGRESAGMIADRRIDGGQEVDFFGAPKATTILPARLALRFGVPLVPVQVVRLPRARFVVRFHPPLHATDPHADHDAQATDLTRQINATFEGWIRQHPGQWLCTSKIWPTAILMARTEVYTKSPKR